MPIKVCWTLVVLLFPFVGVCAWACCGPYDTGGGRIQHSLSQRYGRPGPESGPFAVSRPQPQTQPELYANTYGGPPQYGPHRPGQERAGSGYDEEYGRQPAYAPEGEPPVVVAEEFKQPERYAHSYGKQPPMAVAHRIE